jgi:hypothetical protein
MEGILLNEYVMDKNKLNIRLYDTFGYAIASMILIISNYNYTQAN